jgi:hypothetical protein
MEEYQVGLGKEKGEFDLYANSHGSVKASLTKRNQKHLGEKLGVNQLLLC